VAGLAKFRTLSIEFRYKSVELLLWQMRYLHLAVLRFRAIASLLRPALQRRLFTTECP